MSRPLFFLGLLIFFLTGCGGEYEEKEREIGYKGVAKLNRFLAAERLASELGMKAFSYAGAPSLPPPPGTTLILPAEALRSVGQLDEVSDWVLEGGNLIAYLTADNEPPFRLGVGEEELDQPFEEFLDYFGFDVWSDGSEDEMEKETDSDAEESPIKVVTFDGVQSYKTSFKSPYLLVDSDYPAGGVNAVYSYQYGEGYLTVLGSAELFTNQSIGKAEHATLFWDLLNKQGDEKVWIVYSTRLSFFKLLWMRAPHAVVCLLTTIVLLIWWAARGFGPKFVRGADPSAKLDEHLEASGAFFLKHKAEMEVITHQREKLFRRIARATNQAFNVSTHDLVVIGQQRGVLNTEEAVALTQSPSDKTLLGTLQTLKNLDKKL